MIPGLLSLKIQPPAPPALRVRRPGLVRLLDEGLEAGRPLTLVSAPAGFGKTTCVSDWLSVRGLSAAWLSLNAEDQEPGRFFLYLIAALKSVSAPGPAYPFPRLCEVESVLRSGQLPAAEVLCEALMEDILNYPGRLLLVLDDFHLIQERFILGVFERLFSHLFQPNRPQPLHLVLITREDPPLPLARLRANNRLTEIRARTLRFSVEETGAFLKEVMGLALDGNEIASVDKRVEGWAAGLQLAALSLRGRGDVSSFLQGLSGSRRSILSYLIEEVLGRQSEEVQQFLLDTAILNRLDGGLCDAVTGRADSARLLDELYAANLFLVQLDEAHPWYRYHHLFAELLRDRQQLLDPGRQAEMHRRASRWFAGLVREAAANDQADFASLAVEHALAAEDYAAAVRLIETYAARAINQWYLQTVQRWLQALPAEWSARSPQIALTFARLYLTRRDFARAAAQLERLEALFAEAPSGEPDSPFPPALLADWRALKATFLAAQGKAAEALALARQARDEAPEQDLDLRSRVYLALAAASQAANDSEKAAEAYAEIIRLGRRSANVQLELLGASALGLLLIERGRLREAFELAGAGIEHMQQAGLLSPISAGLYGELGQICFHRGRLEQAEAYFQLAIQTGRLGGFSDAEVFFAVSRSRIRQMQGDLQAAGEEIHAALQIMQGEAPLVVSAEAAAQQINVLLALQDLPAAERAFERAASREKLPDFRSGQPVTYPQGVLYNCALRIRLHQARAGRKPASPEDMPGTGSELLPALLQRQYIPLAVETLLLRAQLFLAQENLQAALDDLETALDLAEPEGLISAFVLEGQPVAAALRRRLRQAEAGSSRADFIHKILAACAQPPGGGTPAGHETAAGGREPGLIEALTGRELEVLRLMRAGRTYAEIAGQLVVSINTVRTHIKSIYGKLGVDNRTSAVEAARNLGLL